MKFTKHLAIWWCAFLLSLMVSAIVWVHQKKSESHMTFTKLDHVVQPSMLPVMVDEAHFIQIDLRGKLWLANCQTWIEKNKSVPNNTQIVVLLDDGNVNLTCEELRDIFVGARERKKHEGDIIASPTISTQK